MPSSAPGKRTYTGPQLVTACAATVRTVACQPAPIRASTPDDSAHRGGIVLMGPRPTGARRRTVRPLYSVAPNHAIPDRLHAQRAAARFGTPSASAARVSTRAPPASPCARTAPRPGDPTISPALVAEHGLTAAEYARVVAMLGRDPTFTELGIVSALWSEHCSYKHSRPLLKTLPTSGP